MGGRPVASRVGLHDLVERAQLKSSGWFRLILAGHDTITRLSNGRSLIIQATDAQVAPVTLSDRHWTLPGAHRRRSGVQVWRSALPSMARGMVIRRCRQVVAEDLRSLRRRDNTGVVSLSSERLVLPHISRVFWGVPRFGRFWRWPAKPLADCLLVLTPVVGQHSLADAERRPIGGSFLNVAAEAF